MSITSVQKVIELCKGCLFLIAMLLVIVIGTANADVLVGLIKNLKSFEAPGFKMEFNSENIERTFPRQFASTYLKEGVNQEMQRLSPGMVKRLFFVTETEDVCDFENPDSLMTEQRDADIALEADGLISREANPKKLEKVKAMKADSLTQGKSDWEIGNPTACYDLKLTSLGADVKSALVHVLADSFSGISNRDGA